MRNFIISFSSVECWTSRFIVCFASHCCAYVFHSFVFINKLKCLIFLKIIFNVVLISAIKQHKSTISIRMSPSPWTSLPHCSTALAVQVQGGDFVRFQKPLLTAHFCWVKVFSVCFCSVFDIIRSNPSFTNRAWRQPVFSCHWNSCF